MVNESNSFKDYTNHLAETLQEKNDDYGDSFSRSVDKFGIIAAVRKIDDRLDLAWSSSAKTPNAMNVEKIIIINHPLTFTKVYDFTKKKWLNNGLKFLNLHQESLLNDFINQIEAVRNSDHELIIPMNESNPFKDYTNH